MYSSELASSELAVSDAKLGKIIWNCKKCSKIFFQNFFVISKNLHILATAKMYRKTWCLFC